MQLAIALLVIGFVLMFFEVLLPGMVLGACAQGEKKREENGLCDVHGIEG